MHVVISGLSLFNGNRSIVLIGGMIVNAIATGFLVSLLMYHLKLIWKGVTTYDEIIAQREVDRIKQIIQNKRSKAEEVTQKEMESAQYEV